MEIDFEVYLKFSEQLQKSKFMVENLNFKNLPPTPPYYFRLTRFKESMNERNLHQRNIVYHFSKLHYVHSPHQS